MHRNRRNWHHDWARYLARFGCRMKTVGIRELIKLLQAYEPSEGADDVPVSVVVEGRAVDLTDDAPAVILYPQGLRICLGCTES